MTRPLNIFNAENKFDWWIMDVSVYGYEGEWTVQINMLILTSVAKICP